MAGELAPSSTSLSKLFDKLGEPPFSGRLALFSIGEIGVWVYNNFEN